MKEMYKHGLILVTLCFCSMIVFGQVNRRLKLSTYSTLDGLSNNNANVILQDEIGYIWIGTENGLNRYNGHEFENADDIIGTSLSEKFIRCLALESNTENFWIGNHSSLQSYNFRTEKLEVWNIVPEKEIEDIRYVFIDSLSNVWVSIYDEGVFKKGKKDQSFKKLPSLPHRVYNMVSFAGDIWLGYENGFAPISPEGGHHSLDLSRGWTGDIVNTMLPEQDKLWVGTQQSGFLMYDPDLGLVSSIYNSEEACISINSDNSGNIWLGTEGGGLVQFNKSNEYVGMNRTHEVISKNSIRFIYRDRQNYLWFAPYNEGISVHNPNDPFINLTLKGLGQEGLSAKNITALAESSAGTLLIGSDGGGIDEYNVKTDQIKNIIPNLKVLSIDVLGDKIWIGTYQSGLWKYENNHLTQLKIQDDKERLLTEENIWDVKVENENTLWMATNNGLLKYHLNEKRYKRYSNSLDDEHSLIENECRVVYIDIKGDIWVGTFDGISRYRPESDDFNRYYLVNEDSLKPEESYGVLTITEDYNLNFWIGTFGHGMLLLDRNKEQVYKADYEWSVNSKTIYSIEATDQNELWYSTNRGLGLSDPASGTVRLFGFEDGLQSIQYNYESSIQLADGYLVFGGNRGLSIFKSENLHQDHPKPVKPILTSINLVDGDGSVEKIDIHFKKSIEIAPSQRKFRFDFLSFDFRNKQKIEYQYRLGSFDQKWNKSASRSSPLYSNLDPGNYTYQVRSRYFNGPWSYSEIFNLTLKPLFVETWIFKVLLSVFFLAALIIVYYLYTYRIKQQRNYLDKLVKERSQELMEKERIMADSDRTNAAFVKDTLKVREKELTAQAVRQIHLRNVVEQIKDQLEELQKNVTHENSLRIKRITSNIALNNALAKDWELLDSMFAQVHKQFIENLHQLHPRLTGGNLRLCSLMRMNLSTRDIASIIGITESSAKMARKRLRKKLELDSEVNLQEYILSL